MQMFPIYGAELARIRADELTRLSAERHKAARLRPEKRRRARRKLQVARPLASVLIGVRLAAPADERAAR